MMSSLWSLPVKAVYPLFVLVCLALGACDSAKKLSDHEHLQQAKAFQEQGKIRAAAIELNNALQKNPNNAEAHLLLGQIYANLGYGLEAETQIKRAEALGIHPESLKESLGRSLLAQGQYRKVLSDIQPSSSSSSRNLAAIKALHARAQFGLGRYREGCELFSESVVSDANYVPAYWGKARCATGYSKPEEAKQVLKQALQIDPTNADTWTLLGDLENDTKRLKEAENAYSTALRYNPQMVEALLGRAVAYLRDDGLEKSNADIAEAAKVAPNYPLLQHVRGMFEFKEQRYDEAKTSLEAALKGNPTYLPTVLWLGFTNYALGNFEQAAGHLRRYVRTVPDPDVVALLADVRHKIAHENSADTTSDMTRKADLDDPQSLTSLAHAYSLSAGSEPSARLEGAHREKHGRY